MTPSTGQAGTQALSSDTSSGNAVIRSVIPRSTVPPANFAANHRIFQAAGSGGLARIIFVDYAPSAIRLSHLSDCAARRKQA